MEADKEVKEAFYKWFNSEDEVDFTVEENQFGFKLNKEIRDKYPISRLDPMHFKFFYAGYRARKAEDAEG